PDAATRWQRAEHRPDDGPGEHPERERRPGRLRLGESGGTEEHERDDAPGLHDRRLGGDRPADRVANEHGARDPPGVEVAEPGGREPTDVVARVGRLVAEAKAREVDRVDAIAGGE